MSGTWCGQGHHDFPLSLAAAAVVALYLLGQWGALLRRAGVNSIGSPTAIGLVLSAGRSQAWSAARYRAFSPVGLRPVPTSMPWG